MSIPNRVNTQNSIRHESGHLVVAKACGFSTCGIKLWALEAGAELTLEPSFRELEHVRDWLERRIVVLYAGAVAESLKGKTIDQDKCKGLLQSTAKDDMRKIAELMRLVVAITHPDAKGQEFEDQLAAVVLRLSNIAANTVLANQNVILDVTSLFIRELEQATRANRNKVPDPYELPQTAIDEFLKNKEIVAADMMFILVDEPGEPSPTADA